VYSTIKFTLLVAMLVFLFAGCTSDRVVEIPSRSVRILMSSLHARQSTLVEFIEPNVVNFVSFGRVRSSERYSSIVFDTTLLDNFVLNAHLMELILPLHHFHLADSIIINEWTLELLDEQLNHVRSLIENVARNRADREFELAPIVGNIPYVWAIIDNDMYWSLYTSDVYSDSWTRRDRRRYFNSDMLQLTYKLIDLSPYPVGSEISFRTPGSHSQ